MTAGMAMGMTMIDELLVEMIGELPLDGGDLVVSGIELELPIESLIDAAGRLHASWPRGRMVTGFDPLLGAIAVTLAVEVKP